MKYTQTTASYNERRYSRPWIAKVNFCGNSKGDFTWGQWIGVHGYAGLLEINCEPGDIIAIGQKDSRQPRNSAPVFYIMQDDMTLECISKVEAYQLHNAA